MPPSIAGILYGPMQHHLDHLAPLCALLDIPLIVTDEGIAELGRLYYPGLKLIYWDYLEAPQNVVASFDILFCALPRPMFNDAFLLAQALQKKQVKTIWVPHGNSDKGHTSNLMEGLQYDEAALVYGPKMVDFLKMKNSFVQLKDHLVVGNFRLHYYRLHQPFYDSLVRNRIPQDKKIALYAPTWNDAEASSSLTEALAHLIKAIPEDWRLVVKPHPNDPLPQAEHPKMLLLTDFPPIYPILEASSTYVGDMSSIGYDFLAFRRPMFFFNPNRRDPATDPGLFLFRCGTVLDPSESYQIFNTSNPFASIQEEVYRATFGPERPWEEIRSSILSSRLTCVQ